PAEPQRDFRESRDAEKPRQRVDLHDALHGRSRAACRSDRRHGPRQGDCGGHARRTAVTRRDGRRRQGDARNGVSHADRKEPARLMPLIPFVAMVRKDLQLFFSDRRSVIISFVVPIAIGSFFGAVFASGGQNRQPARIAIAIIDQDGSTISKAIVAGAEADENLRVSKPTEEEARDFVRRGRIAVAVVIPPGFGDASGRAFFGNGEKPELKLLHDPSKTTEFAMVRGVLTQHVMEAVSREMFSGDQGKELVEKTIPQVESSSMPDEQKKLLVEMLGSVQKYYRERDPSSAQGAGRRGGITMPYTVHEEAMTAGSNIAYNGYAHQFAGMAIQFLLFAMANLGIEMLLERQRGLWGRLRSAPVSKVTLLSAKAISGTLISLLILLVSFGFAMIVFSVRIQGSVVGFLGIS